MSEGQAFQDISQQADLLKLVVVEAAVFLAEGSLVELDLPVLLPLGQAIQSGVNEGGVSQKTPNCNGTSVE